MRMKWVVFATCAVARIARADEVPALDEVTDIKELSLSDLLDTKVDVASKKPQSTRETPGIVTVITRDDIVSSGARDLLDVLVLVPGFSPAVDVEGIVDLGIRDVSISRPTIIRATSPRSPVKSTSAPKSRAALTMRKR